MLDFTLPTTSLSTPALAPTLLLTATAIETESLHSAMTPRDGEATVIKTPVSIYTYYLGKLGGTDIVHVQCVMGSATHGGSILTASHAIRTWAPRAIIMVGIAFGIDEKKQKIGDVLVSRQIIPYEPKRVCSTGNIYRGIPSLSGPLLLNRFSNAHSWCHDSGNGENSCVYLGDLLSGEELIDNKDHRDQLAKAFPEAIGGEMEGCGLTIAAREGSVSEWIVVKGICDFADGNKSVDKDARQRRAIKASVSLCEHILSSGLNDGAIYPGPSLYAGQNSILLPEAKSATSLNDIFFVSYKRAIEHHFYQRDFDKIIASLLEHGNLWLWGKSGVGKTVILQRAALRQGHDCIFVDLSSATKSDPSSLLEDAYWQVADFFGINTTPITSKDPSPEHWVRALSQLIAQNLKRDTTLIIDEFSIKNSDFESFLQHAISLILKLTNLALSNQLHIAFASTYRPIASTDPLFSKLQERIPMVEMQPWTTGDIEGLAHLINSNLQQNIDTSFINNLRIDNPRTLKTLIRLHLMDLATNSLQSLLETAQQHSDELS